MKTEDRIATLEAIVVGLLEEVTDLKEREAERDSFKYADQQFKQEVLAQKLRAQQEVINAQAQVQLNQAAQGGLDNTLSGVFGGLLGGKK